MQIVHLFGVGSPRHRAGLPVLSNDVDGSRSNTHFDMPFGSCVARWNLSESKIIQMNQLHQDLITCLLRANNGMIASCSDSGEVAFWAQDWTPRGRLSLPSSRVCHAAWSLDGALLAVCTKRDGGRLTVIDARAPQPHIVLSLPGRYETAEWCSDRRLFTITQTDKAGEPSFCSLIDPSLPADQCIVTHNKVADMRVLMSAANGQDRVALLMADRRLLVLDMPTFQPVFEFPASGRAHTVQTMLFDGDCITVPAPGGRFAVYTLGQSAPVYVPCVPFVSLLSCVLLT